MGGVWDGAQHASTRAETQPRLALSHLLLPSAAWSVLSSWTNPSTCSFKVADLDTKIGVGTDEKGKVVRLQHLLNMVDCTDANGNTPLSEASGGGHPEAIRMLIENGGHPNSRVRW